MVDYADRTHHAVEAYVNLSKSSGVVLRSGGDGLNASAPSRLKEAAGESHKGAAPRIPLAVFVFVHVGPLTTSSLISVSCRLLLDLIDEELQ